jgi:hypothetical protein
MYNYTRREIFSSRYKFDKKFYKDFVALLDVLWFKSSIKLPKSKDREDTYLDTLEFYNMWRNFPAIIFKWEDQNSNTIIKVLFVNLNSANSLFSDDIYPSWHSESPQIYISWKDPLYVTQLFEFVKDYINTNNSWKWVSKLLYKISNLILITQWLAYWEIKTLTSNYWFESWWMFFIISLSCLIMIFIYHSHDTGLFIKEKETWYERFVNLLQRISHWDLKDNILIKMIINIFCIVIGGIILRLIWNWIYG